MVAINIQHNMDNAAKMAHIGVVQEKRAEHRAKKCTL